MFKKKDSNGNSLGVGRLGNRFLRLFRPDRSSQASLMNSEQIDQEVYNDSHRVFGNALQEAENKKAEVIMELQKRQRFY